MDICLTHQVELVDVDDRDWKGKLRVCPVRGCGEHRFLARKQAKLPGLDPGRQERTIRIREAALVRQAADWGALAGYECLQIGQQVRYPRCPACKKAVRRILCPCCMETFAPALTSHSTTGAPDTFWTHRGWEGARRGMWKAIEAKEDAGARVRPEQQRLVSLGLSELAWSLEMFQRILRQE